MLSVLYDYFLYLILILHFNYILIFIRDFPDHRDAGAGLRQKITLVFLGHDSSPSGVFKAGAADRGEGRTEVVILHLADEEVGVADHAVLAAAEALIRADRLAAAVGISELQLHQQRAGHAVLRALAARTDAPGPPAVAQQCAAGVAAGMEQPRHIIALVIHVLVIRGEFRGEAAVTGLRAIEGQLVNALRGGVDLRTGETLFHLKLPAQQRGRTETLLGRLLLLGMEEHAGNDVYGLFPQNTRHGGLDPGGCQLLRRALEATFAAGGLIPAVPKLYTPGIAHAGSGLEAFGCDINAPAALHAAGIIHGLCALLGKELQAIGLLHKILRVSGKGPAERRRFSERAGLRFVIAAQANDFQHGVFLLCFL